MTTYTTCPACHYTRKPTDDVPEWECPNCQKVYDKAVRALNTEPEKLKLSCTTSVAVAKPIIKKAANSVSLRFADPVSEQTEWTPMNEQLSGFHRISPFPNHKLINVNSARIEFLATIMAKVFCVFDLIMGMVFLGFLYRFFSLNSFKLDLFFVTVIILAASAAVFGIYRLYNISMPLVFDKSIGFFWKGKTSPGNDGIKSAPKCSAKLEEIHSIQIISHYHPANRQGPAYFSYELNLVLRDAGRINLDAHRDISAMQEQANTLSGFLGKPVWDASI